MGMCYFPALTRGTSSKLNPLSANEIGFYNVNPVYFYSSNAKLKAEAEGVMSITESGKFEY
jgi:hypothetical protein